MTDSDTHATGQQSLDQRLRLTRAHGQRLRQMYRSAGWPCLDNLEIDLLAAGLLERVQPEGGREHLRVTDAGVQALSQWLNQNRRRRDAHAGLLRHTAEWLSAQGRIAFAELSLLARPGDRWLNVRPDIYAIRRTTIEAYLEASVYEVKVRRSDLLSDLKRPEKREGYLFTASRCFYVLSEGIADPSEIPESCGVIVASRSGLELARAAPVSEFRMPFSTWMALSKATPYRPLGDPETLL